MSALAPVTEQEMAAAFREFVADASDAGLPVCEHDKYLQAAFYCGAAWGSRRMGRIVEAANKGAAP